MKKQFLFAETGDPYADLNSNISETYLDLENIFGSPEKVGATVLKMVECSVPEAKPHEKMEYLRILEFFQNLENILRAHEETFYDLKYELRSYTDGRFIFNEKTAETLYFDHPGHREIFKKLNKDKQWITTETK